MKKSGFDPSLKELTDEQMSRIWGAGGGGGGSVKYDNLEKLYGAQYEKAMGDAAFESGEIRPRQIQIMQEAEGWGSDANAELAAQRAGADVAASAGAQQAAVNQDMASMGIDPSDSRYMGQKLAMANSTVAQQAGASTGAREGRKREGLGIKQAAVMGMPIQANASLNSAAQTGGQIANLQQGQQASRANGIYGAIQGVGALASMGGQNGFGWWGADGGLVRNFKSGGYVGKFASGGMTTQRSGMVGEPIQAQAPPPDSGAPPGPSTGQMAVQGVRTGMSLPPVKAAVNEAMSEMGFGPKPQLLNTVPAEPGYMVDGVGSTTEGWMGTSEMAQAANAADDLALVGENVGTATTVGEGAGTAATLGEGIGGTAALGEGFGTAAAVGEGVGTAAAAGEGVLAGLAGSGVGLPLAAAGALALIGHKQGWFADGGQAKRGIQNHVAGGEVDGPGGPKDDLILAHLSDGEFVMPIGTVKKYGIAKLEKMRQEGLEFEKQLGIAG
jgi:hypothetical protein